MCYGCFLIFRAMFCTDLREKHERCVNIQGIDAEDMKMLLDYTYTSKVHITKDNVQKTLEAASLFQVCDYYNESVINIVSEYYREHVISVCDYSSERVIIIESM